LVDGASWLVDDGEVIGVFPAEEHAVAETAAAISGRLGCVSVSAWLLDGDLLGVFVHRDGVLVAQCVAPDPSLVFGEMASVFHPDDDVIAVSSGRELVAAVRRGDPDEVEEVLADEFLDGEERHERLLAALGLPTWSAGWGFGDLVADLEAFTGPPPRRIP
jgi:hypothetical protein